ncbi:MAG TPA: MFS transporter [Gemmatimonadaceae bacterium]|nr:MFS transporter [Gemmatimonadaceae bacterium]
MTPRYRWTICALLFFATTINYIDRQVLGILAPTLQAELGWTEVQYATIVSWFTLAYALGYVGAGRLLDKIGVRLGFAVAVTVWSIAAMAHAMVRTAGGFGLVRFALGLGESGNFPASIKGIASWFPVKERAFAMGIVNAGTNIGAIITPLVVPFIALRWGWRTAFLVTGALGFVWLVFWLMLYRTAPETTNADGTVSGGSERQVTVPWLDVLRHRQAWAFIIGKLMTDPVWWFYLFWLPKFLDVRFEVKLASVAAPLIAIYLLADVGSVGGGWIAGAFMRRGWSLNRARKVTMLLAALAIVPTMFAPAAPTLWITVAVVGLAAAAHQWWSTNLFTLPSDMFPQRAIGTVVGIGGFAGAASGFFFQRATGAVLQSNGNNYTPVFLFCGLAYVSALLIVHLLVPRMAPAELRAST